MEYWAEVVPETSAVRGDISRLRLGDWLIGHYSNFSRPERMLVGMFSGEARNW
jgi:hypothetical protein